ncbi:MAG: hypothetical protein R6X35_09725 [Candidatus Krumholzibacteriia bacterium]
MRFADEYDRHVPDCGPKPPTSRPTVHRRGAWVFAPCGVRGLDACAYHLAEHLRPLSPEGTWAERVVRRTLKTGDGLHLETLVYVRGTVGHPGEPPLRLDGWHLAARAAEAAAVAEPPLATNPEPEERRGGLA